MQGFFPLTYLHFRAMQAVIRLPVLLTCAWCVDETVVLLSVGRQQDDDAHLQNAVQPDDQVTSWTSPGTPDNCQTIIGSGGFCGRPEEMASVQISAECIKTDGYGNPIMDPDLDQVEEEDWCGSVTLANEQSCQHCVYGWPTKQEKADVVDRCFCLDAQD